MRWWTLVFDLDNTLYNADTGVFQLVNERISRYLTERIGMSSSKASAFRVHAIHHFGTTLRGLRVYYPEVKPLDFLEYCHSVPLHKYLAPDPDLRRLLERLPQRKIIFTNSDKGHTQRVLEILGIQDQFDAWVTIESLSFIPKPLWESYAVLTKIVGHVPSRAVYLDDMIINLKQARRWGFQTVWVTRNPNLRTRNGFPIAIPSIHELDDTLHRL